MKVLLLSLVALYGLFQTKSLALAGSDGGSDIAPRQSSSNCICGVRNTTAASRIVGGKDAKMNEFPWRVAIYVSNLLLSETFCTGTILNERWVLTAAHCIGFFYKSGYVIVGAHNLTQPSEPTRQKISVKRAIKHENYNSQTYENDIALLELVSAIILNYARMPACLPTQYKNETFPNSTVITSGWGTTKSGGGGSKEILRWVQLNTITNVECGKMYSGSKITDSMLCTYTPGSDTCQGDSGTTIESVNTSCNRHFLIGIVSWGDGCAKEGKPGVNTRVTSYLDWIKTNTNNATFCTPSC